MFRSHPSSTDLGGNAGCLNGTSTHALIWLQFVNCTKTPWGGGTIWVWGELTTTDAVGIVTSMRAVELVRWRIVYSSTAFAELVLWRVPQPLPGSPHSFKYRLAYVVRGVCVLRYDNEVGKGDHRHYGDVQSRYQFTTPEQLLTDFQTDIARWNRENRDV